MGVLADSSSAPLVIEGLWGLQFGNGLSDQPKNALYFTAGPDDEDHGLFGRISPVPEPAAGWLGLAALSWLALRGRRPNRRAAAKAGDRTNSQHARILNGRG